jgi:DNA-binding NtrC family response regulator
MRHDWPGNVRELRNTIERLVVSSRGGVIDAADLSDADAASSSRLHDSAFANLTTLDELERRYLRHVLDAVNGNRTRAAEILGIDRRTLYRMAERFGIELKE